MCDSQTGTFGPDFERAASEPRLPGWLAALLILGLSASLWALLVAGARCF